MSAAEQTVAQIKKPLNIYQRINEVRKKVNYAKKDKEVAGQGYKAVTHDAVTALLRNHLIDNGILIVPRLIESKMLEVGKTQKGSTIYRYEGRYEVDFVNCDAPEDRFTVTGEAHANDSGDKAPGKATSYATKYAMLKLFSIETGEDDEARAEPYEEIEKISERQVADLEALISEVGADRAKYLEYMELDKLENMPAKAFKIAVKALEAKRKKPEEPKK